MAAQHLGRTACPECGFHAAHVRQNEGKHPYRYCPECGANYATRNSRQAADLVKKTRPVQAVQEQAAEPVAAVPAPAAAAAPAAPVQILAQAPERASFWSQLAGARA